MNKFIRAVALLLCATCMLSLAACVGGGGEGNTTYGRYVEEDITPPDMVGDIQSFYYNRNGVLDVITIETDDDYREVGYHRYRSVDNAASWETVDMAWADEYVTDYTNVDEGEDPEVYVYLNNLEILENGDLVAVVNRYMPQKETSENEIISATLEGGAAPVTIPLLAEVASLGEDAYINSMFLLDGTRMVLDMYVYSGRSSFSGSQVVGLSEEGALSGVFDVNTGEQLVDFTVYDGWNYFYGEDTLYMETEEGEIKAYSLKNGKELDVKLPESELVWNAGVYPGNSGGTVGEDHTFYGVSTKGLMKLAPGMEETELIMDSINYSYGSPACWVNNLYVNGDEILMTAQDEIDGSMLLRYVWDKKALATSDKHLTVYSLYENQGARLALSQFKKQNPDVSVTYESAMERYDAYGGQVEGGMTAEDALRALNTELLAGNGPDVLILDDLPLYSYIEQGILEDLSDVVEGADIFHNVIEPLRTEKGLFAVPSHISIPLLFGQEGKVDRYESLDSLLEDIENGPSGTSAPPDWETVSDEEWNAYWEERNRPLGYDERPVMQFDSLAELVSTFYETSAPAMYSEATGLDKQALREYLEAVKTVSDAYGLAGEEYAPDRAADSEVIALGGTAYTYPMSMEYYGTHRTKTGYTQLASPYTIVSLGYNEYYSRVESVYDEKNDLYEEVPRKDYEAQTSSAILAPGLASGVYFPQNLAGVCSTSKQKDLAKEFVATMLGYDVQKYNWYANGLSINVEAFDKIWADAYKPDRWREANDVRIPDIDVKGIIDGLTTPYFTNEYLLEVIYENVVPYCRGEKNLDSTIDSIVKETEIYFAERQ